MLKVMTIVGTRPEVIRLSRVIAKFDEHFDHVLVHTGQNFDYELNQVFFEQLAIRAPDRFLNSAGETAAETIANVIKASDEVIAEFRPDAVLLLGDTNSCLAAISAKRRKVPVFHMEAGNRCFDQRVPEEINRKIVDHISDINIPYSTIGRGYLIAEGFPPDQIVKLGSPMKEVLDHYREGIAASEILATLGLEPGGYFLVSVHREENVDDAAALARFAAVLDALAAGYKLPVIVSAHPRTRKRMEAVSLSCDPLVRFCRPFGFLDYIKLQTEARAVLSDSGTITEESSILNFPALNLRYVHERPEGVEEAAVMFVGLDVDRVMDGLGILATQGRGERRDLALVRDYDTANVSDKMIRIVVSYTDYVRKRVWREA